MELLLNTVLLACPIFVALDTARHAIAARSRKVGGIHFCRLGRYQFSFCRCRKPAAAPADRLARAAKGRADRRLAAIAAQWSRG